MKRIGLAVASLSLVFLLTGCGGKERHLECTKTLNEDGVTISQVYTLDFSKKNKFSSAKLVQDMKLDDNMLDYFENYKEMAKKQFEGETFKDLNPKLSDNGNDTVTVTVDFNAKDIDKISGGKTTNTDYESIKKELENAQYTCKEK